MALKNISNFDRLLISSLPSFRRMNADCLEVGRDWCECLAELATFSSSCNQMRKVCNTSAASAAGDVSFVGIQKRVGPG